MKLYKLTDAEGKTRVGMSNETQWGEGVSHVPEAPGEGDLCGPGWIHGYEHPLLAVLHNPIHGDYDLDTALLWECTTTDEEPFREGQMKLGVRELTTVRTIPLPQVTLEQQIAYGIHCALCVYIDPGFVDWAEDWLAGRDRSIAVAHAAACAVDVAYAARAAYVAAYAVAHVAYAAAYAAANAANAAYVAAYADPDLDLLAIAKTVCSWPKGESA